MTRNTTTLTIKVGSGSRGIGSLTLPSSLDTFVKVARPTVFNIGLEFFGPFVTKYVNKKYKTLCTSLMRLKTGKAKMANVFNVLLYLGRPLRCVVRVTVSMKMTFIVSFVVCGSGRPTARTTEARTTIRGGRTRTGTRRARGSTRGAISMRRVADPMGKAIIPATRITSRAFTSRVLKAAVTIRPASKGVMTPYSNRMVGVFSAKRTMYVTARTKTRLLVRVKVSAISVSKGKFMGGMTSKTGIHGNSILVRTSLSTVGTTKRPTAAVVVLAGTSSFDGMRGATTKAIAATSLTVGVRGWVRR